MKNNWLFFLVFAAAVLWPLVVLFILPVSLASTIQTAFLITLGGLKILLTRDVPGLLQARAPPY